ncbi:MAG: sugar phosphate isomerase/epimerase [Leptolyngbya sp. PLA3]|nr:MAG: sugar phosphate isomerase/epimerase [Cyanobacteria bacterium CYA]MCE7968041.1 sugar phosphate isomerase/epimerase [Leptolyngbya sp. PL-A3]
MIGRVGVCSWSLQASGPEDLAEKLSRAGARGVQIALDPLRTGAWGVGATVRALEAAGVMMLSGMMATAGEDYSTLETIRLTGGLRPDAHWEANLRAAEDDARLAGELGLRIVTFHAGFLPHERKDPERAVMMDRLGKVIRLFAARGVSVGFETGQETAGTLLEALVELPGAAVNFDPANMILYGMGDPADAMRKLSPRIIQAHVKDAVPTQQPGTWGTEVPVGAGSVDWKAFFETARKCERSIDLMVEREAGNDRIGDIRSALALIAEHIQ